MKPATQKYRPKKTTRYPLRDGLVALLMMWIGAVSAFTGERVRGEGISPRLAIVQLHHRAFTVADGAPTRVTDMAQDAKGYLWLSSKNGLYRFDGVRFDDSLSKRLPSQLVRGLLAESDGGLWVGYYFGGVSHIVDDRITTYRDGLPPGTALAFARTPDGNLWVASTGGIGRFDGHRWIRAREEAGYTGGAVEGMAASADGSLWISTAGHEYFVLRPKINRFQVTDRATFLAAIRPFPASLPSEYIDRLSTSLKDSAGALWVPSPNGIERLRWSQGSDKAPEVEPFGTADGLSDATTYRYFEDRDSNVWVSTALGVDQFRETRITPHDVEEHLFLPALAFDADGIAWVGTTRGAFRLTPESTRFPDLGQNFSSVARDRLGAVWMAGESGLFHIEKGRVSRVDPPSEERQNLLFSLFQSITLDGDGNLWVAVAGSGLYRRSHGQWVKFDTIGGQPTDHIARVLGDAEGSLWIALGSGKLVRLDEGKTAVFTEASGLKVGAVTDFALDRQNKLVGGEYGLAQMLGDRFHPILGSGGHGFQGITGIVQLKSGDVWIQNDDGIVHILSDEMRAVARNPEHEVGYEVFDQEDGLIGKADNVRPLPSLAEGRDDRVWITTTRELASVNTPHILRNRHVPQPEILSVIADRMTYLPPADITLPAHTRNIRIAFTAPALTMPLHTRFRVKLNGLEENWQEIGTRREAFYTNLNPGIYRFSVDVTNEDGVTSEMKQPLVLHLTPAFYQTWWFRIGVAALGLALLVLAYRRRMRLLNAHVQIRIDERERIARELHDTLLQSIQGLLLTVESAVHQGPLGDDTRDDLQRAVVQARAAVVESRNRVHGLRNTSLDDECPLEALLEHVYDANGLVVKPYSVEVHGRMRPLDPVLGQEVAAILWEALRNASRHGHASRTHLFVNYGRWRLTATVTDDGVGMAPGVLSARQEEGHWGISGMRERADKLGGKLRVTSQSGKGTVIWLRVPTRGLYRARRDV